ncbi:MAG: prolyl aminopeptidase [Bacteroidetes bacterium GWF2_33_16]|nr:MAG: prolyl aminopeptidase [Bacteroidetes bacterium GWE2_32_14]OFY08930.1 MAG: prolyl aminopeptidase [Bacteroidetes bacterium GWF2_33_16]
MELWPKIEPFQTGYLKVSDIHEIYYELCGNPEGIPVFVIHGGPGLGCNSYMRCFFNPNKYLIVLHDQRGCGRSIPNKEINDNNTNALIGDIEQLRLHLKLDKIILFGGSWGSTLSLAYAEKYPENIKAMVLRGIYFATIDEEKSYYPRLKNYFPELYESCMELIPDSISELNSIAFYKLYLSNHDVWEKNLKIIDGLDYKSAVLYISDEELDEYYNLESNISELNKSYAIFYHYVANSCFLEDGQLLNNLSKIHGIPVTIINGRFDMKCPPLNAYILHKNLPGSKLIITDQAGHTMTEETTEIELIKAMKELETKLN